MKLKIILTSLFVIIACVICYQQILSNSAAPPVSNTGAPSEGNCTSCHFGPAVNTAAGMSVILNYNGGATTYSPGGGAVIVNVTIVHTPWTARYGFEATSLDATNTMAGTFTAGPNTSIQLNMGRSYIGHTSASGIDNWSFSWTPPASNVGNVTFYVMGNAGNGDFNSTGDSIVSTTLTLTPSASVNATYTTTVGGVPKSTVCSGDTVLFTNTSTGSPTFFAWDFDNTVIGNINFIGGTGHQSIVVGPHQVVYTNTGTTPVTYLTGLIASTTFPPTIANGDSESHLITVMPAPSSAFTVSNMNPCSGAPDTVTISSVTGGVNYTWNWGVDTLKSQASATGPFHIKTPAVPFQGQTPIFLTATNSVTGCSSIDSVKPYASICALSAFFPTPNDTSGTVPSTYYTCRPYFFTDVSISGGPAIVSWQWSFDSSNIAVNLPGTASGPGPHRVVFSTGGNYNITETVTDAINQTSTFSMNITINGGVASEPLMADFNTTPPPILPSTTTNVCVGDNIIFADQSICGLNATTWDWDFGDGTMPHPTGAGTNHAYTIPNTYTVTLIAGDGNTFDTISKLVVVAAPPVVNVANNDTICSGNSIPIGGPGTTGVVYSWFPTLGLVGASTANPTASPTATTTYYVNATEPLAGCQNNDSVLITVGGVPSLTVNVSPNPVCLNSATTVTTLPASAGTYKWNFGGGTIVSGSGGGPYQISWPAANTYTVFDTVTDAFGCSAIASPITVTVQNCIQPIAGFILPSSTVCTGVSTNFTDTSLNIPTSWAWSFGTGAIPPSSTFQNPVVTFLTAGKHYITLHATNAGGTGTHIDSVNVVLTPTSTFNMVPNVCIGVNNILTYTGSATPAAIYTWSFGVGTPLPPGTGVGPQFVSWPITGTQAVTLQVTENGCTSSITTVSTAVNAPPVPNFNFNISGQLVQFNNLTPGTTNTYTWTFGDISLNSSLKNPIHNYATGGQYTVCLTATNGNCSAQKCDSVVVFNVGINEVSQNGVNVFYQNEEHQLRIVQNGLSNLNSTVSIYNVEGQLLAAHQLHAIDNYIPVADLAVGVYVVKVVNGEANATKKFVVEK